jgi:thioredoxin-like negative regulator of GroEL
MANQRAASGNAKAVKPAPAAVAEIPAPAPAPVASFKLFRKSDWIAAAAAFAIAMAGYIWTMAPNVTLEDSGELITAAHHLGVPHPPGYPIWTVLGFLFDHLNPLSPHPVPDYVKADGVNITRRDFNIAWRVTLMSATFAGLAAAMLALLVSRSGSMLLRSAQAFHEKLTDEQERWIAAVCGTVGALIFAYSPVPWSQAVVGEVYTLNGLFMALTTVTMFIWMHDPQRDKYLYWTAFLWALGLTNHQTLLFMAPAYFILIALVSPAILIDMAVGACWVIAAGCWFMEWVLDDATFFTASSYFWQGAGAAVAPAGIWLVGEVLARLYNWPTRVNWKRAAIVGGCVLAGLAFYGYSPLASSTNPPMNWGFTQHKDGFWHHLSRGQYEKVKIDRPWSVFWNQMSVFFKGLLMEYTGMFVAIGFAALAWFRGTAWRAKTWIIFMATGIFFTSVTFIVLANPTLDRAVLFNDRVFFMLTHALFCACIGYGLIWGLAFASVHFEKLRWLLYGAALMACMLQLGYQIVYHQTSQTATELEWFWVGAQIVILFGLSLTVFLANDNKLPLLRILALVACLPIIGMFRNWRDNEMRGHMFGWYFGYHMFEPGGGYPPMDKNAVLYGGTDPGRFVPTYAIFCPRVHPDVYIITQNALAENTYLRYLRYQYASVRKKDGFTWLEKALGRDTVYPKDDIYISTDEDSAAAIRAYVEELQHRPAMPGEVVEVRGGRVNIQGVQAVTALNGLVSKQIFDKEHDKRSFYVEESFVIQWMYNYLEPYGIIMKINREPLPKITPEMVAHNRRYWTDYIQKYLLNDPRFRRDDDAQRAFSKLRTAHAGLYAWRVTMAPPEQRQPELAPEAEFAFRQAIDLCPFNVEATFRFAEFLTRTERYDDALKLVDNYKKYDPHNIQVGVVLGQINTLKQMAVQEIAIRQELQTVPNDLNRIMTLLSILAQRGKFGEMDAIIDRLIENKDLPPQPFKTIAQTYVQLNRFDRVERVLAKYLGFHADDAQAWYDLAVVQVQLQRGEQAIDALEKAIRLNPQFKQGAAQDQRLTLIRLFQRFKELTQ